MARRGKKQAEHENHERWLITYSDLITLLLVFFVIMYSMSKVDDNKYEILARSLNLQFKSSDSLLEMNSGLSGTMSPTYADGDKRQTEETNRQANIDKEEYDKKEQELADFKDKIETYIQDNKLESDIVVTDTTRGITITLSDVFLFDTGKADLKPPAFDIMDNLATLLPGLNAKVAIEGHTDNVPIRTGSYYKDNWELSVQRSLSVIRYLTGKVKLNEKNFIATGYGDTMPKVENDTPENRAKNRRVEVTILR
ncbi:flagellar motor protein [Paenibacillus albiflavus]|uniref:Flagellar motor protein n=1 Tax=Paenibacillus albiflavus TaxID=2545760 RepID=A0A4R4E331_9BACL|nr:flagellar motor protein MotB [Paenibacillus albiflavus]TCZ70198.1 flagellar motor protein [Paenibacillus albiflavus]